MELREALSSRRMTRAFAVRPLAEATLVEVLDAARSAPSAGFSQGVELLVLASPQRRRQFWELSSDEDWRKGDEAARLFTAPVVVVVLADAQPYLDRYASASKAGSSLAGLSQEQWPVPYWLIDAAFAAMLIMLAAEDHDLGTLFFHLHRPSEQVLDGLGVPAGKTTIGALLLGHKAPDNGERARTPRRRRSHDEVVHRERY